MTQHHAAAPVSPAEPIWGREIPFRNPHFTGRDRELDILRASLGATSRGVLGHPLQPLYGMGGVGKTEIAAEYCHRHEADYDLVWWVRSEQEDTVRNALIALGRRMGLAEFSDTERDYSSQIVLDALRTGRKYSRWLLVFDNVTDPDMIRSYIPRGAGHVIITSRIAQWRRELNSEGIEVGAFKAEESVGFLRRRIPGLGPGGTPEADEERLAEATRLADALGHLPLASEHAAAYLIETRMAVDDYLVLYRRNAHEMLGQPVDIYYPEPVATTWSVSLERISDEARSLFKLLCFFSPEPISEELIVRPTLTAGGSLPEELGRVLGDQATFRRAVRELARFSLLKIFGVRNVVQVHRVVQDVTRGKMQREDPEQVAEYRGIAHELLAASDPGVPDKEANDPQYELSKQHLIPSGGHESANPRVRALIINQVRRMRLRGGNREGLNLGQLVFDSWRERFGPDDLQTLMLALEVSICLFQLGEVERAGQLTIDTQTRLARTHGRDNEAYLKTAGTYSRLQRHQGNYAEAHQQDVELLPLYEEVFRSEHLQTLNLLNNIALDLRCLGRYEEALSYDRRAHDERRRMFGDAADYTLSSKFAIARDLRSLGRVEEALDLIREVCRLAERKNHPWHAVRLQWETELSAALRWVGLYEEARQLGEENFERHARILGPAHRQTLNCAVTLVFSRTLDRDLVAAARLGEETLLAWEKVTGDRTHPNTQAAAVNLAVVQRLLGNPLGASRIDQEALDHHTARLGAEHPGTATVMTNLASDLAALGNVQRARELGETALKIFSETLGESHPRALAAASNLVLDRRASGETDKAQALCEQTLARYAEVLPDHPHALLTQQGGRIDLDIEPMSQ
ncbi:FxSxx-COOH system tetratricopeptide repeat protein [Nonomuraea cavernae]|uniref:FxSxx-COOH system tetratricopeptide repeat protein n=1 Tax=Nonomuraea cavernae TaxID=2045107 RepID=UPI0033CE192F